MVRFQPDLKVRGDLNGGDVLHFHVRYPRKWLQIPLFSSTIISLFCYRTAFFSPYWLKSVPDERLPNPKFLNLGKKEKLSKNPNIYRIVEGTDHTF